MARQSQTSRASEFVRQDDATRLARTIARVAGEVGTGKTRFPLTGPEPIYYLSLDKGLEGVIEEFIEQGKEIHVADFEWSAGKEDFTQVYAQELYERFMRAHYEAVEATAAKGTIVWDKESDVWQLARYAAFGKPNDTPKDYGPLNARYIAAINAVKATNGNLFLIQAMKDSWGLKASGGGPPKFSKLGKREIWGFDRVDELVYAELMFRREVGEDGPDFYIDTGKVRQNSSMSDQTFPAMTLPEFGTLLVPGSTEEDWL